MYACTYPVPVRTRTGSPDVLTTAVTVLRVAAQVHFVVWASSNHSNFKLSVCAVPGSLHQHKRLNKVQAKLLKEDVGGLEVGGWR